ncbi:MAG: SpoIIE family protein phosphatase [Ignavibacteriales bacterium]|nr:SpoIIE family protein phosphatase [Ignavibacteriales bacterium]
MIYRGSYSTSFISLFFAEFENNGNLFYANGGHPSPLIFKNKRIHELHPYRSYFWCIPRYKHQAIICPHGRRGFIASL